GSTLMVGHRLGEGTMSSQVRPSQPPAPQGVPLPMLHSLWRLASSCGPCLKGGVPASAHPSAHASECALFTPSSKLLKNNDGPLESTGSPAHIPQAECKLSEVFNPTHGRCAIRRPETRT